MSESAAEVQPIPTLVHRFDPCVVVTIAWRDDDCEAASGGLDTSDTLCAEGFVAHVTESAGIGREQISRPGKPTNLTPPTGTETSRLPPTVLAIPLDSRRSPLFHG